jgi:hypothetical protein
MPAKKTHEQFLAELQQYNAGILTKPTISAAVGQSYNGLDTPLTFVCAQHGEFATKPRNILVKKAGCPECSRLSASTKNTKPVDQFLDALADRNTKHPAIQYVSGFVGTTKKCTFSCDTCGHTWDTEPKSILRGHGCPECAKASQSSRQMLTQQQFLSRLIDRNESSDETVDLHPGEKYLGNDIKIKFTCSRHHTWEARPNDIVAKQSGCPQCAGTVSRTAEQALTEIKQRWPNLTILSNHFEKLGRREQIEAQCEYGHTWNTHYERLIQGHYCPHCNQNARYDLATFTAKLSKVNKTVKPVGNYVNVTTPIETECLTCGHTWKPRPYNLLQGYGCPSCSRNNKFSKKALAWLAYIETTEGIEIQHARKYGEFRVPGTRYRADGYCEQTNTVYEFYGDYWHGNPLTTEPTHYNQHLSRTYGDLYKMTIERENGIRSLGFNVVSMWESEYDCIVRDNFTAEMIGQLQLPNCKLIAQTPYYIVVGTDDVVAVIVNTGNPPESDVRSATQKLKQQYTTDQKYCVVLFADEVRENSELVRRKIIHYTGNNTATPRLHTRQLMIRLADKSEKKTLLDKNHIQGNDNAQVNLGAYYGDKLVAVMTFSHPRVALGQKGNKDRTGVWELSRFCTDVDYRIPGVASRLLKHFQRNWQWREIYSYADKRWSVGGMYEALGFQLVADNPPDYFYVVDGVRKHRWNYRKDVLKNTLPGYDPMKTEYDNMVAAGYWRVWDCGTLKYSVVC